MRKTKREGWFNRLPGADGTDGARRAPRLIVRKTLQVRGRRHSSSSHRPVAEQLHIQTQALQLPYQDVEGLRQARFRRDLPFDQRLVDLGPSVNIIRLGGQQLLQRVGGPVGLQSPTLHLPEPLPAELGLAPERLLGDEGVGAYGARVDLVVHQV